MNLREKSLTFLWIILAFTIHVANSSEKESTQRDCDDKELDDTSEHCNRQCEETEEREQRGKYRSSHKKYKYAAVETQVEDCSKVGMDILVGKEGTAVDAAIATMFCLGVANPGLSGIGGGHLATIYQVPRGSNKKMMITLDARETLPGAGHKDFFKDNSAFFGGTSVGVPGEVLGLYTAWQMFGTVPWQDLVTPAITLAEKGFKPNKIFTHIVGLAQGDPDLRFTENFWRSFHDGSGSSFTLKSIIKLPALAATLRTIAKDPLSFYQGQLADNIVSDIKEYGGILTKEDLLNYRVKYKQPVMGELSSKNLKMYSPPPPSSGVILQLILRLLDGFDLGENEKKGGTNVSDDTYHKLIEAWKFAYAQRTSLGDGDFYDIKELMDNLTDSHYIDNMRRKIDLEKTRDAGYYGAEYEQPHDAGTANVNVYSPDGSAVAITGSLNYVFGAEFVGTQTGIFFNNCMDDFSVPDTVNYYGLYPSPANYPFPGKSPMSTMSPTIILTKDGTVAFVMGGIGGAKIVSSMSQVAFQHLYLDIDLATAMDLPRIHHQHMPEHLYPESAFDKDTLDGLLKRGHDLGEHHYPGCIGIIKNNCALCEEDNCPIYCIETVTDYRFGAGSSAGY